MNFSNKTHKVRGQLNLIKIKKIDAHAQILYEILRKRKANISHGTLPSYAAHRKFVLNHPYRAWYLIKHNDEFIGNAYILKNNCIGVVVVKNNKTVAPVVIKELLTRYKPLKAIKSVRANEFDFNVTPNNKEYIDILEKMGAKIAQITYVFDATSPIQ